MFAESHPPCELAITATLSVLFVLLVSVTVWVWAAPALRRASAPTALVLEPKFSDSESKLNTSVGVGVVIDTITTMETGEFVQDAGLVQVTVRCPCALFPAGSCDPLTETLTLPPLPVFPDDGLADNQAESD